MIFIWLILCLFSASVVQANTRLGLHVTQDELNIWKQRAATGPYKTTGDVRANSPGDWDRIITLSGQSLSADRWAGYTGTGCVPASASLGGILPKGDVILGTAFRYLVEGNTTLRTNVINELVTQAGVAGTNFANSAKWCVQASNTDNFFRTALWLTKYIYAWDYILAGDAAWGNGPVNSGNQATIEAWLLAGATYFDAGATMEMNLYYANFNAENFTPTGEGNTRCAHSNGIMWYGSVDTNWQTDNYSNRRTSTVMPFAMVGIQQNNATLKAHATTYVKAMLQFGVFSDNSPNELQRMVDGTPSSGLNYALTSWGLVTQIADAFARNGDTTLYDYSTSNGACGTLGGPKSILGVLTNLAKYVDHTWLRYGTSNAANNGNANWLIDTVDGIDGAQRVIDHVLAQPNLYYQDTYLQAIYKRTATGQNGYTTPGYPSNPATGGYYAWGNSWGIELATLFMFGQMEGLVDPYNASITWSNTRTGGSGDSTTCCANWTISNIPLLIGENPITVTATDSSGNQGSDTITVTAVPSFPGNTLAGAWGFNEGSGSALDSSGNANSGTLLNGVTRTSAIHVHDIGVVFDGVDEYINVPDSNSLDFAQSFTFSAWITMPVTSTGWKALFAKDQTYNSLVWPMQFLYAIGQQDDSTDCAPGTLQAGFIANGSLGPLNYICGPVLATGSTPVHVALTYDGAFLRLYVQGVEVASKAASGYMEPTTGTDGAFRIGWDNLGDTYFAGTVSSPRVYNYALARIGSGNTTPGAACVTSDAVPTIVRDMNCPIIAGAPPVMVKFGATATVKFGADAIVKFGATPSP